MIELKNDSLKISFPDLHQDARCSIDFMRTLRIPDDGREYPLPAGIGSFPLNHIEDFSPHIPDAWNRRGGVLMPMYQSEAMWLNFGGDYPMAIKVAAGKINAVTGEVWKDGLSDEPQDYLVLPEQPWLDGYNVEKDLIRQFVAMPLGQGYSAEEQITGEAEFGGVQIIAYPMKAEVYREMMRQRQSEYLGFNDDEFAVPTFFRRSECVCEEASMGLAAGGLMRQEIYEDEYGIDAWDIEHSSRCFVHLVNSESYVDITGKKPPHVPVSKKKYAQYGIPWFDYYDDGNAVEGSKVLSGLKSLAKVAKKKGEKVWDNDPVNVGTVKAIKGKSRHTVSEGNWSSD